MVSVYGAQLFLFQCMCFILLIICDPTPTLENGSIFVIGVQVPHYYDGFPSQVKFITPCVHPYLNEQNELNKEYFAEVKAQQKRKKLALKS